MMQRVVVVVAVLVLVAGTSGGLAAQGALDRKFVATGDGAVWVVLGSMRYRIQPTLVTPDDLSGVTPGEGVATVDQLLALLNAGGPAAAPAEAPPAPANPAAALVGTATPICFERYRVSFEVLEAQWLRQVGPQEAKGMYVLLVGTLRNGGTGPLAAAIPSGGVRIVDERGRAWPWENPRPEVQNAAGARPFNALIASGTTDRVIVMFDVAPDVGRLQLVSTTPCS